MWNLQVENIAGIRSGQVELTPGANIIQASNWQGKTSLLVALRAILGGSLTDAAITEGEEEGSVHLETDSGTEFTVELTRQGDSVVRSGTPYLTDEQDKTVADLFAFLDEQNNLRSAVRNGEDLTPYLLKPIQQEDIESQIDDLQSQRRSIESDLEDAKSAARELPNVEQKRTEITQEIDNIRSELEALEESEDGDQEGLREELNEARTQLQKAQQAEEKAERQIDTLETQLADAREELEGIDIPSAPDLESKLERKREELEEVDRRIDPLRNLWSANKEILDENLVDTVSDVERSIDSDHIACWTCGSQVTPDDVQERLDALQTTIQDLREDRSDLQSDVEELESRKQEISRLEDRKESLQTDIESYEENLEAKRSERSKAEDDIETWEERVSDLEAEVTEVDDEQTNYERKLARKEAKLESVEEQLEELEDKADERDALQAQVDEVTDEIESLRGRREELVDQARDAFADAIEDVLIKFAPSFEAARLDKKTDRDTGKTTQLDLVLVRDGQEISVDALSEGEVELIGFIAALAGYEAFDVSDRVPVILLDDVGGLAGEHLTTLVQYLNERTNYLVSTAYPETGSFDGSTSTVSPDEWDVVSDHIEQPA